MKGILDKRTGLSWSDTNPNRVDWATAKEWCKGLGDEWRMPTIQELVSLVDYTQYSPAVPWRFKSKMVSSYYWSSTSYADYPQYAWVVLFYDGYVFAFSKTGTYYVRAVRGGSSKFRPTKDK